jgi:hypothetical protein
MEKEKSTKNVTKTTTIFGEEDFEVVSRRHRLLTKYQMNTEKEENRTPKSKKDEGRDEPSTVTDKGKEKTKGGETPNVHLILDDEIRCSYCGAESDQERLISRSKEEEVGSLFVQTHSLFEQKILSAVTEEERDILIDSFLSLEEIFLHSLLSRDSLFLRLSHSQRSIGTRSSLSHSLSRSHIPPSSLSSSCDPLDPSCAYMSPSPSPSLPSPSLSLAIESFFLEMESLLSDMNENDVCLFLSSLSSLSSLSGLVHPSSQRSLLHLACSKGKPKVALILIEKGFSVNCVGRDGLLPIHLLFEKQISDANVSLRMDDVMYQPLFEALLNGVDPNYICLPTHSSNKSDSSPKEANSAGDTLLHFAAQTGSVGLFTLLTSMGANIQAQNLEGVGVMEYVVRSPFESSACDMLASILQQMERESIIELGGTLLRHGVNAC